jgi:6-phosphogluconolactonase
VPNGLGEKMQQLFLVGSYTHPSMNGKGEGIYSCSLDTLTGKLELAQIFPLTNPSYITIDKTKNFVFVVEESAKALNPHIHSFRLKAGELEAVSQRSIPGEYACHVGVNTDNTQVAVANYGTGNVVLYELKDGQIVTQLDEVQHVGKSINEQRQEAPHAHAVVFSPDNQFLLVADLGLDEIKSYRVDAGKLQLHSIFKTKPGAGPRQLEFHPNGKHVFIINELDASLITAHYQDGRLTELQTLSTLPENYTGEKWAAAIHVSPNGNYVYASNRLHNSIAVFSFDEASERLQAIQHIASGGNTPRDFALDPSGKFLITAHQESDDLFSFFVNDGRLEPTGYSLKLGTPVCIAML